MTLPLRLLVPALFFCSGAAALVYEVIWSKYLGLIFGSTAQAQTTVLAVFMAGLALGNNFFGRIAHRQQVPLERYGYMEVGLGLWAFFFPQLYALGDSLFVAVGAPFLGSNTILLLIKGAISLLLLFAPTFLMGGTLPMMAVWLARRSDDAARLTARFYAINTIGAVTGAAFAGFYLVQNLGLPTTLQCIGGLNVLLGIAAIAVSRRELPGFAPKSSATATTERPALDWRIGLLVATTGAISLALEGLAARALALVVGGSLYAFATVLIAFILGIGVGGSVIASPRLSLRWPVVWILLAAASLYITLFILGLEQWTIFYSQAKLGLAQNATGYSYHQALVVLVAIIALGIPAALLGAVLPLCLRTQLTPGGDPGAHVGRLLTWNALGAVVGALASGFVLMPLFGLRGSLAVCSALLAIAAFLYASANNLSSLKPASVVLAILVILGSSLGGEGWRHVLGSGVFRLRTMAIDKSVLEERKKSVRILYYEDAADATVAVETSQNPAFPGQLVLKVNGKADASSAADLSTQMLLGHLPVMARPDAKDVFVLGLGSGITCGAILAHPGITNLTVAENCRPIIEAAELFAPFNQDALKNPRTRLFFEDARTVLKLSPQQYDIIISEPSNPWTAGIGSVFSLEFYQIAAARLKEGGVMAQWFHIYEMDDNIINMVLRTFRMVFPYVEIWEPQAGDLILIGGQSPWDINPEKVKRVFAQQQAQKQLQDVGLSTPETVFIRQLASQRTAWAIPGDGGVQQDHFPVLEYTAPRAFFIGRSATQVFDFDERTEQFLLASPAKRELLRGIGADEVWKTLTKYPSDNTFLMESMRAYIPLARSTNAATALAPAGSATIFHPRASLGELAQVLTNAVPDEKLLNSAENAILAEAEESPEVAGMINSVLRTLLAEEKDNEERRSSLARFAAIGAKVWLIHGRPTPALELIALGREFDATLPQLGYLERIANGLNAQAAEAQQAR
ncbi:MAG TPA: fused MFS/spermidine synthase [Methylomirabilota bacterium]|nr:fused MFS/spermidine synthase [Methylomirabilota bacterium]